MKIIHITQKNTWLEAQKKGLYQADTLASDGFIHCCMPEQVQAVLEKWFAGVQDVVFLEIDTSKVKARIVEENLEGGSELFPHIYGPLNLDAVENVRTI